MSGFNAFLNILAEGFELLVAYLLRAAPGWCAGKQAEILHFSFVYNLDPIAIRCTDAPGFSYRSRRESGVVAAQILLVFIS